MNELAPQRSAIRTPPIAADNSGADHTIHSLDVAGAADVQRTARELCGRSANRGADAHAGHGERITVAAEDQDAVTAADAEDEAAFGKDDANLADPGTRWSHKTRCEQSRNPQLNDPPRTLPHAITPLARIRRSKAGQRNFGFRRP